jgi:hypothetical protein
MTEGDGALSGSGITWGAKKTRNNGRQQHAPSRYPIRPASQNFVRNNGEHGSKRS